MDSLIGEYWSQVNLKPEVVFDLNFEEGWSNITIGTMDNTYDLFMSTNSSSLSTGWALDV